MAAQEIQTEAKRLIVDHIDSVAQLELLLLLRVNPQQRWTGAEISREMRVEPAWAASQLAYLCDRGMLQRIDDQEPAYVYHPRSADLEQALTALAQAYILHRVSIVEMIHTKPSASIRAFADAFKLRKEPPVG